MSEKDQHQVRVLLLVGLKNVPGERNLVADFPTKLVRRFSPDDRAGAGGEGRPIRSELEFHRNAGHHAEREVHREELRPKASGAFVARLPGTRREDRVPGDERRQPHRPDRKKIVEEDRKRELETIHRDCVFHAGLPYGSQLRGAPRAVLSGRAWSLAPRLANG